MQEIANHSNCVHSADGDLSLLGHIEPCCPILLKVYLSDCLFPSDDPLVILSPAIQSYLALVISCIPSLSTVLTIRIPLVIVSSITIQAGGLTFLTAQLRLMIAWSYLALVMLPSPKTQMDQCSRKQDYSFRDKFVKLMICNFLIFKGL
jgi:hypothetical protein